MHITYIYIIYSSTVRILILYFIWVIWIYSIISHTIPKMTVTDDRLYMFNFNLFR